MYQLVRDRRGARRNGGGRLHPADTSRPPGPLGAVSEDELVILAGHSSHQNELTASKLAARSRGTGRASDYQEQRSAGLGWRLTLGRP
jgi:hypothetical protein